MPNLQASDSVYSDASLFHSGTPEIVVGENNSRTMQWLGMYLFPGFGTLDRDPNAAVLLTMKLVERSTNTEFRTFVIRAVDRDTMPHSDFEMRSQSPRFNTGSTTSDFDSWTTGEFKTFDITSSVQAWESANHGNLILFIAPHVSQAPGGWDIQLNGGQNAGGGPQGIGANDNVWPVIRFAHPPASAIANPSGVLRRVFRFDGGASAAGDATGTISHRPTTITPSAAVAASGTSRLVFRGAAASAVDVSGEVRIVRPPPGAIAGPSGVMRAVKRSHSDVSASADPSGVMRHIHRPGSTLKAAATPNGLLRVKRTSAVAATVNASGVMRRVRRLESAMQARAGAARGLSGQVVAGVGAIASGTPCGTIRRMIPVTMQLEEFATSGLPFVMLKMAAGERSAAVACRNVRDPAGSKLAFVDLTPPNHHVLTVLVELPAGSESVTLEVLVS